MFAFFGVFLFLLGNEDEVSVPLVVFTVVIGFYALYSVRYLFPSFSQILLDDVGLVHYGVLRKKRIKWADVSRVFLGTGWKRGHHICFSSTNPKVRGGSLVHRTYGIQRDFLVEVINRCFLDRTD